ncbi:MAG TPA: hypothetical protein VFM93_09295 [Candidatus Limnocylindria bacterium]|nr:hypothetical protein [Candidatus Limnocylindria bacterium]
MPIRKLARTVDAALRDADLARKRAGDPDFRRRVRADRREALSEFATVRHAIAERERAAAKAGGPAPKKGGSRSGSGSRARTLASTVNAAFKDADRARRAASDPSFRKGVQADRRATLSRFSTVKHALADRERIEKRKKK